MFKRNFGYIFCLMVVFLCLISRIFAYIIQVTKNINIGFNGYEIINVKGLGFWGGFLNIFQYIFLIILIVLICISLLEILRDLGIIKFEIIYKKITSFLICKICLFLMFIVSFLEVFFVWFIILANNNFLLVFGAGTIVLITVCFAGLITFFVLEKKYVFKDDKTNENKQNIESKQNRPQD